MGARSWQVKRKDMLSKYKNSLAYLLSSCRPARPGAGWTAGVAITLAALLAAGCKPATEGELLAKADTALVAGDESSARIHLMNVLQLNQANVTARLKLADLDLDALRF